MSLSLKDINRPFLVLVTLANLTFYYIYYSATSLADFGELMRVAQDFAPAGLISLIVGVANAQLTHAMKARLVFWRWQYPLPGSYAFTEIMQTDERIDPVALLAVQNPLPTDPAEQNRLWFKWYREVQGEAAVSQVHREYLFTRDWAGLAALLGLTLAPLAYWQMGWKSALLVAGVMVLQYLLVRWSARNHGRRFVASVLAYKSA